MKPRRKLTALAAASVAGILGVSGAISAYADTDADPIEAIEQVAAVDEGDTSLQVLENTADLSADSAGEHSLEGVVAEIAVSVPVDPRDAITLDNGQQLSVTLPFGDQAADATPELDGVVSFDNHNGSTSVPVVREDGSVQILTVIDSAAAPTEYTYTVDLPEGGSIQLLDGGFLAFVDGEGAFIGGASPAWAYDANGAPLATSYVVDGNTFTQVVEHGTADVAYPVVADPWLGQDLYWQPYITTTSQGWKVNVRPRQWGIDWAGISTWWAHRDEVYSKLGPSGNQWRWTNTIQEQFYCHIAGVPLSLPIYNLESWRVNWTWNHIAPYKCNFPEGYFY